MMNQQNGMQINPQQLMQLYQMYQRGQGQSGQQGMNTNGIIGYAGTTSGTGTGLAGLINGTSPLYQTLGLSGQSAPAGMQQQWNQSMQQYGMPNTADDAGAMSTAQLSALPSGSSSSGGGGLLSGLLGMFGRS